MTTLLPRPARRVDRDGPDPSRPLTLSAVLAALRAAAVGLVSISLLVVLGWAAAPLSGADGGEALRAAGLGWLAAHRIPLATPLGPLALVPIGLLAVPALLLVLAGARAARAARPRGLRDAAVVVGALAVPYAGTCAAVAALSATPQARAGVGTAFAAGLLGAAVLGGVGVLRAAPDAAASLRARLPARAGPLLAAGAAGAGVLVAAGALLVTAAVAVQHERVADLARGLQPGGVGGVLLLLLGAALVPNAAVMGASVAVGPGFAVGAGTQVGVAGVTLGAVPALPLLGALPAGSLPAPAYAVLLAPVVAGVLVARVVGRRLPGVAGWAAVAHAATAGTGGGLLLGVLAALAGGPVGGGRLGAVGSSPWQVGLAAAVELAAVAAAATWARARPPFPVAWTMGGRSDGTA